MSIRVKRNPYIIGKTQSQDILFYSRLSKENKKKRAYKNYKRGKYKNMFLRYIAIQRQILN